MEDINISYYIEYRVCDCCLKTSEKTSWFWWNDDYAYFLEC
jgi:hypothetical protein